MAKVDINTQTGKFYENAEKSRRREKLQTDTDKIKRGAGEALFAFGLHTLADTVANVAQAIDDFKARQEELANAEAQSLSARASTFNTKIKGKA